MNTNTFRAAIVGNRRKDLLARAQTAFETGDFDSAIRLGSALSKREPDHLGALEILARAHWRAERYEEALGPLDQLIALNPYEPGYFYLRGVICQGLGRFGEAIDAMQRCLSFTDSPVAQQALAAMRELESWQETLIAELLQRDPVFRTEYARDPIAACAGRGYRFADSARAGDHMQRSQTERALVWSRVE